jgi:hypothetical protein
LTIKERQDYNCAKEAAIESPNDNMNIIIDGMDQNTMYVLKFKPSES